jgi:hypothetical protein
MDEKWTKASRSWMLSKSAEHLFIEGRMVRGEAPSRASSANGKCVLSFLVGLAVYYY